MRSFDWRETLERVGSFDPFQRDKRIVVLPDPGSIQSVRAPRLQGSLRYLDLIETFWIEDINCSVFASVPPPMRKIKSARKAFRPIKKARGESMVLHSKN